MPDRLDITVMLGGRSAEREVSLRSGAAIAQALRGLGHNVHELDPKEDGWSLPAGTDLVFLALHGTYGEDGTVQQQLEALGVPYTGSDAQASRVAFDKLLAKERFVAAGVPTAMYTIITSAGASWPIGWDPPVVLKPARQGSSVGVEFVERVSDWADALAEAFRFDVQVLVEEKITGREVTVGILGEEPLPVVEVRPRSGRYDYRSKYTPGATEYLCPAPFDSETTAQIQAVGLAAFRAVGGRDYARVDMIVKPDGSPVVLEVNTLPGMTETSLFPKAAVAAGLSYTGLCERMVELALRRTPRAQCSR